MKDYWDIASRAFPSVNEHADAPSAGLLNSLRLSQDVKGFFKPLTATSKTADDTKDVLNPMVGCQVTLEGIGVQWASAQVLVVTAALGVCLFCCLAACLSLHGELTVHMSSNARHFKSNTPVHSQANHVSGKHRCCHCQHSCKCVIGT